MGILSLLRIYYFSSLPPVILGILYLIYTRDFLINNRLHDYSTADALRWKRPEPCSGTTSVVVQLCGP